MSASRIVICCLCLVLALPAMADRRALVIGNAAYEALDPLQNTIGDAEGYAEAFGALGFEVTFLTDLDEGTMVDEVVAFVDRIAPGDEVAFVFAGHGWSADGINYLIPTDAPESGSARQLARRSLPLKNGVNGVLDDIAAQGAALSLAIIDACRDNPFASEGTRSIGSTRGLARIEPQQGSFVIYSAGEGQTALDRLKADGPEQKYSVFTRHFLPLLTSDMYLEDAVFEAQERTARAARAQDHRQIPAVYRQKLGKTCLTGACRGSAGTAPAATGWFVDSNVPEGVHLGGAEAPLVSPDRARIYLPVHTVKVQDDGKRLEGVTVEVFDLSGNRVSAFALDITGQGFGFTGAGEFFVLGDDSAIHVYSESGRKLRQVALSQELWLPQGSAVLASGRLRVQGEFHDFNGIADIDLATGEVSDAVMEIDFMAFSAALFSPTGHFAYREGGKIRYFDPGGSLLHEAETRGEDWGIVTFTVSPAGLILLQYRRSEGKTKPAEVPTRLVRVDQFGLTPGAEYPDVSTDLYWEIKTLQADPMGVSVVALLDESHAEIRRFDPFGQQQKWSALVPWTKTGLGPPRFVSHLPDGGALMVQYPTSSEGTTDASDVVRLTRIGPEGRVPLPH